MSAASQPADERGERAPESVSENSPERAQTRLEDSAEVMRVIKVPVLDRERRPAPANFALSSADRKEDPPSLSVWDRARTTVAQAIAFTPPRADQHASAWRLEVGRVRALRRPVPAAGSGGEGATPPGASQAQPLDVVSVPLFAVDARGQRRPDDRPGARGHCGIVGLQRPKGAPKRIFKALRARLARMCERISTESEQQG